MSETVPESRVPIPAGWQPLPIVIGPREAATFSKLEMLMPPFGTPLMRFVRLGSVVRLEDLGLSGRSFSEALCLSVCAVPAIGAFLRPAVAVDLVGGPGYDPATVDLKRQVFGKADLPYFLIDPSEKDSSLKSRVKLVEILKREEALWHSGWQTGRQLPQDGRRGLLCNTSELKVFEILSALVKELDLRLLVKPRLHVTFPAGVGVPGDLGRFVEQAEVDFAILDRFSRLLMHIEFDEDRHLLEPLTIRRDAKKKLACDVYGAWSPHRIYAEHLAEGPDGTTPLELTARAWLSGVLALQPAAA